MTMEKQGMPTSPQKEVQVQEKQQPAAKDEHLSSEKYFAPHVDIYENKESITLVAEMPGVTLEHVEVSLEDEVLTLRGNRTQAPLPGRLVMAEYEVGNYLRRFTITTAIDQEKITGSLKEGLLTVVLPKAGPAKPRSITVQAG